MKIYYFRSSRWTTVNNNNAEAQATNAPNCPEDATGWADGSTPAPLFCGNKIIILETCRNTFLSLIDLISAIIDWIGGNG
jgi:hypothetical protein